jgi:hypothetical protein
MKVTPELGFALPERTEPSDKEMLSVRLVDGKYFVRINYSSLAVIQTCLRKAELMLYEKFRSKVESPATLFGTAVHKALEVFYSAPREERMIPVNFAERADVMIEGPDAGPTSSELLFRCIRTFLTHAEPLRALPDNDKRSLSAGVWLLCHYFRTYIDDPFTVLTDERGPITERFCESILLDSAELQITYFGTVDVVLRNDRTGVILPCDHKTSSVVGNEFYSRLKPNAQYSGYCWLAQNALGLDVDSFLVNALQVKSRPVTARGGPPQLPRQVTKRTQADLAEFKESVIHGVRTYIRATQERLWVLGDVNSCSMYGGCTFLPVCSSPAEIRKNVLEANFVKGKTDAG